MLDQLRRGAGTFVAKIFIGLLVISFGIWGIADIFNGFGRNELAVAGDTEITPIEFQRDYDRVVQNVSRRTGRVISPAEARQFGLPGEVLGRLVTNALLNDAASDLGVGIGNEKLAEAIQEDPAFAGPSGGFNRQAFDNVLASNGFNEALYIDDRRKALNREQLIEAVIGGLTAPEPYLKALNRYQNEQRVVRWITITEDTAGPIPDPTDEELRAFFDAHKADFQAPEYRAFDYVALTPEAIADPSGVSEEELQRAYDSSRELGEAEKRQVQQIVFDDRSAADKALADLRGGASFADVVAGLEREMRDVDLGLVARPDIVDPAVGDAAFSLEPEQATVVDGRFGPVLVRVAEIQPARKRPFEEVRDTLAGDIALERAEREVLELYDSVEDAFAGGATVGEVGERFGIEASSVAAIDELGRDPDGTPVELPQQAVLVKEVFDTDVNVENAPLPVDGGYLWYRVTGVTPPRERTLDEVRGDVIVAWTASQVAGKLDAKADEVVTRLKNGEPMQQVARELFVSIERSEPFSRSAPSAGALPRPAVAAAFEGPKGHVASVVAPGTGRIVLQVDEVIPPAFFAESAELQSLQEELNTALGNTLLTDYVNTLQRERGVTLNQQMFDQIVGSASGG